MTKPQNTKHDVYPNFGTYIFSYSIATDSRFTLLTYTYSDDGHFVVQTFKVATAKL